MEKTYEPAKIEQNCYRFWEKEGYFAPSGQGEAYCIMIPPPNVTGTLHMGHAFQDTIMDALTRYHRMRGCNTLWQPGTDHAGIATQMVVERQLNAEGTSRREIGRKAFLERVWKWKAHSGDTISNQLRRLGASVDWSRERFTMDDGLSNAVVEVFVSLHDEGLIYRGKRLVNWDPALHTALSDLEVLSEEEDGHLWHFRYPLADAAKTAAGGASKKPAGLVVATTRPETMLGDTAVAVHPDDPRYRDLIGQSVELPLTGRKIPVIADEYVDPDFGSGCVKITPAHDFNDYEIGIRHALPMINILTEDGRLNDDVPQAYCGLPVAIARERVVQDLDNLGLLEKTENHRLKVPRGDRSGEIVEPFLTDQWYVRTKPLAGPAIAAVENGDIRFVPENWAKTYFDWMHNIQDWCISRQLWWGHRIPAWYDDEGNCYVGRNEAEARAKNGVDAGVGLRQDEDVLDTWFSSALWPFSTLGWPERTEALKTFYPTSVLVTGFDIIFFWIARMIMMGLKFAGGVPFREVYIHGLIRDEDGQKMSKAKGNVLDPLDLIDGIDLETLCKKRTAHMMQPHLKKRIEKSTRKQFGNGIPAFGTDALRFTYASLATTGRDIRFDMGRIEGYRNFCNKIWNASRYVLMNTESADCGFTGEVEYSLADRWIRSRLSAAIAATRENIDNYRFDLAARALYEFSWHEFCDWYLELSKPVLQSDQTSEALKRGARRTLARCLEALLRALHPFMPYITEEIWRRVAPVADRSGPTIMLQPYPQESDFIRDLPVEAEVEWIETFVLGIRQIRGEMDISPAKRIEVLLQDWSADDRRNVEQHRVYLQSLARVSAIDLLDSDTTAPPSATALHGKMKVLVPMAGLIDPASELARLQRRSDKLGKELAGGQKKLANPNFVNNAPAEVVTDLRQRVDALQRTEAQIETQITRVRQLLDENEADRRNSPRVAPVKTEAAAGAKSSMTTTRIWPKEAASETSATLNRVIAELNGVILGKDEQIRLCVACLLARGHLLIEDIPGVGKTTLAHALAHTLGLSYQRIQFTSDLLPADIIGVSIFERDGGEFRFHQGPVFSQLVLADEINRATPKTQSALLEAMEENQVTADGQTYPLPEPFFVVATQNPQYQIGTFPLPESQLDRFLMRIELGYPGREVEKELLTGRDRRDLIAELQPCIGIETLLALQKRVTEVHASDALVEYVQQIVAFTRESAAFAAGLSPRAGIVLLRAAQAWALLTGHRGVLPEDVQSVAAAVISHRLRPRDEASPQTPAEIGQFVLESVPIP